MSSLAKALGPVLAALPCTVALAQTVNIPSTNVLPFSAAATNQPGFIWNISQVTAVSPARLADAETIITGAGGPNLADPNQLGTASGAGTVPANPNAPISFVIPGVINFSKAAPDSSHNRPDLPPEDPFAGLPGTGSSYDNFAAESLAWLALPAGQTKIGVRSDDDMWELAIWGRNIFNKHYNVVAFNTAVQGPSSFPISPTAVNSISSAISVFPGEPAVYGVTLSARMQ